MRVITIPNDVVLKTGANQIVSGQIQEITKAESFCEFVHDNLLTRMGSKLKDTRRNLKLYDKLLAAKPGDEVEIESTDWDRLIEAMNGDWQQFLAMQCLPFFEAIENAKDTDAR